MSIQETSQLLNEQDPSDFAVDLYLARKLRSDGDEDNGDEPYQFGRASIRDQMAENLVEMVSSEIGGFANNLDSDENELELATYNVSNKNRDEPLIQHLDFDDIPQSDDYRPLIDGTVDDPDSFDTYYNLKFIVVRLRHSESDTTIVAFQTFTRSQVLKTSESLILTLFQDATTEQEGPVYQSEAEDTLYQIPYQVDALHEDDTIFVFDQRKFERIFNYYEEFRAAAEEVVSDLEEMDVQISGMDHIETAFNDFPNAARLFYDVRELGRYQNLDQSNLQYLDENFGPETVVETNGEYQIAVNDRFDIWDVLRVLNDSHLESHVSDSRYISLSKQTTKDS